MLALRFKQLFIGGFEIIKDLATQAIKEMEDLDMALKELKQHPSDYCVNRQATLDAIIKELCIKDESYLLQSEKVIYNVVKNMPPATPTIPTCDDCVSRQAVKDTIFAECTGNKLDIDFAKVLLLQRAIKALPPVTPTQRWIPVSERLPEDRNLVLVTAYWHETYQVMMASYFGEGLWWCVPFNNCGDHMQKLNPKAWQPLPKPYEGGTKC